MQEKKELTGKQSLLVRHVVDDLMKLREKEQRDQNNYIVILKKALREVID